MPPVESWEAFFEPDRILDALCVPAVSGDAAEFGCGYGTFTTAAGRRVAGRLFALDIDPAMIDYTVARAARAGLGNIVGERRDFITEGSGLAAGSMSFAMMFNILHAENPVQILLEAFRVLRPEGILAVIHWRRDIPTPRGPPLSMRPEPDQCRGWAESAGFEWQLSPQLSGAPWHWGMTFRRPAQR